MTTINQSDVNNLLPHARHMALVAGPLAGAEDASITGMAMAKANAELLSGGWCACDGGDNEVYFRRRDGSHGWMCAKCRGITQTG